MKKRLLLLYFLVNVAYSNAYTLTFKNQTPYTIEASIEFGTTVRGLCSSPILRIIGGNAQQPGILKQDTMCCVRKIQFTRVDAYAPRPMIVDTYVPQTTGSEACRSIVMTISAHPDGSLWIRE